jgi:hypothetical protein
MITGSPMTHLLERSLMLTSSRCVDIGSHQYEEGVRHQAKVLQT